jgi:hypothetical protein
MIYIKFHIFIEYFEIYQRIINLSVSYHKYLLNPFDFAYSANDTSTYFAHLLI